MKLQLLQLLLLISFVHAYFRGQDRRGSLGRTRIRRFLMEDKVEEEEPGGNNMNNNPDDKPQDDGPKEPDVPETRPPVGPPPSMAPVAPLTQPPTFPPTKEPTDAPAASPDDEDNDKESDSPNETDPPTPTPVSTEDTPMNLLDFVVSAEDTTGLTGMLSGYLFDELRQDYDSIVGIGLTKEVENRRILLQDIKYSGVVFFAAGEPVPAAAALYESQTLALEDLKTLQTVSPSIQAIDVLDKVVKVNGQEEPPPSNGDSPANGDKTPMGLIAGIAVAAGVALAVALFVGYRYYNTPPPPPLPFDGDELRKPAMNQKRSFHEPSQPNELPPPDDYKSAAGNGLHLEMDDYSLDGESFSESGNARTPTEQYLVKREKERQSHLLAQRNESFSGDSMSDFSYANVGERDGTEGSISDTYMDIEPGNIEVGVDGETTFVTNMDILRMSPAPAAAIAITRRDDDDDDDYGAPFDEPDERPFDEFTPTRKQRKEAAPVQRQIIAEPQPKEIPIARSRSNRSSEKEQDLTSFLRGRQQAKRASRRNDSN